MLEQLPYSAIWGRYLFAHAGVRPYSAWSTRTHPLPYTLEHGHTFRHDFKVTKLPHRIGSDRGGLI